LLSLKSASLDDTANAIILILLSFTKCFVDNSVALYEIVHSCEWPQTCMKTQLTFLKHQKRYVSMAPSAPCWLCASTILVP